MIKITNIVQQQLSNSWSFKLENLQMLIELGEAKGQYEVFILNEAQGGYDKVQPALANLIYLEFCLTKTI